MIATIPILSGDEQERYRYRFLLLAAIFGEFLLGLTSNWIRPHYYDPILGRLAIGVGIAALLAWDYFRNPDTNQRDVLLQVSFYLIAGYSLVIAHLNAWIPLYFIGSLLTMAFVSLSMPRMRPTFVFLVVFLLLAALSLTLQPMRPVIERLAAGSLFLFASILLASLTSLKLPFRKKQAQSNEFHQYLLHKGKPALLLTTDEGLITFANESALHLLEVDALPALQGKQVDTFIFWPGKMAKISHLAPTEKEIQIQSSRNRRFMARVHVQAVPEFGGATFAFSLTDIDTLKQRETSLAHGEHRLQALLDHNEDAMWIADREGIVQIANQAFYAWIKQQTGTDPSLTEHSTFSYLKNWETGSNWTDAHQRACMGECISFEYTTGEGLAKRTHRMIFKPVIERGAVVSVSVSARKVTEIQTSIRPAPRPVPHYGEWLPDAADAIFNWDIEQKTWTYTPGFLQLLGIEAAAMPPGAKIWRARIHKQDLQKAFLVLKRLMRGNQMTLSESFRMRHAKGHYIWVHVQLRAIRDAVGRPQRLSGRCINVSNLKSESELLRKTFDSTPSSLIALKPVRENHRNISDFEIKLANRAANELLAYGTGILDGQQLLEIMPQCEENGIFDLLKTCFESGDPIQTEQPFQITYTHRIWLNIQATKMGDTVVLTFTDIGPYKGSQEVMFRKKGNHARGYQVELDFLSKMSHEIRTPLNALIGITGLLAETELTPEQLDYVQTMHLSGEHLLQVIGNVLDYSRINSGKLMLEHQSFNLIDCIESVYEQVSLKAEARQLELIYYIDPNVPQWIISDPSRIRQVLGTLVGNAIRYTENGEIYTSVKQLSSDILTSTLEFAVRDTGIGIAPEDIPHIFKSFSETDALSTSKNDGAGLGLALCKKLVHLLGGDIWIESMQWKGSTFYFTIRVQVDPSTPPLHESLRDDNMRGARVLIVDDNTTNLGILRLRCKKWGMEVVDFEDPREALEMIIDYQEEDDILPPFDLAIIDMLMPHIDGNELARSIRAFYGREELPIIMLTSLATPPTDEEKRLYSAYMAKPVKQAPFLDNIHFALNTRSFPIKRNRYDLEGQRPKALRLKPDLRILLVEDNLINQKVGLQIIEKFGYQAAIAGNGIEAVREIETGNYDLIFMDVQMPEMDGLTATRIIRKRHPGNQGPIVIAMTASALKGDREMCLEAGMDDYISKPVQHMDIERAIARWFPAMEMNE